MIKDKIRFNFINELQMKANIYCKYLWNIKFDGVIDVNNRLRSTEAQFIENKNKIEFNKLFLNNVNKYFIDETLIHELCHWYCYKNNMNYNDGDLEFETEIFKNGSRSTETAYIDENNKVWVYNQDQWFYCKECDKNNHKAIKINKSERINYYGVDREKILPICPKCGRKLTYDCEAECEEWKEYYPRPKLIEICQNTKTIYN